ncbi:MAG: twin-arginine translocase TatA/TatE family subunit [Proteobacteria bacterium]|nr:twin-arginine translocase TatA/TatE family subunit [Pseudomonadota bacterium]
MGSFSLIHWIIVLVVVLLLFGPKRLPDLAKGVGEAIREFKKAVNSPDSQKQLPPNDKDDENKKM